MHRHAGPAIDTSTGLTPITDVPIAHGGERFAVRTITVSSPPSRPPSSTPCRARPRRHGRHRQARPSGAGCDAGSVEAYGIALRMFPVVRRTDRGRRRHRPRRPATQRGPSEGRPRATLRGAGVAGQAVRSTTSQALTDRVDHARRPADRPRSPRTPTPWLASRSARSLDRRRLGVRCSTAPARGHPAAERDVRRGAVALDPAAADALRLDQLDLSASPLGSHPARRDRLRQRADRPDPARRRGRTGARDIIVPQPAGRRSGTAVPARRSIPATRARRCSR